MANKHIWCIIGPSGSGKTTVGLQSLNELGIPGIVSYTTRKRRPGEIDGQIYYFVDEKEFNSLKKIENVDYAGNHYCIASEEVEKKLKDYDDLCVCVAYDGYEDLKNYFGQDIVKSIFMDVDQKTCIDRLITRGAPPEVIAERKKQFIEADEFNNGNRCDFVYKGGILPFEEDKEAFKKFFGEIAAKVREEKVQKTKKL